MATVRTIVLEVTGSPSPWANGPREAAWRHAIWQHAVAAVPVPFEKSLRPHKMTVEFRMISSRRGDLDNLAKPVLDTLFRQSRKSSHPVGSMFECDDCYLNELMLRRCTVDLPSEEGATITIEMLVNE